MKQGWIYKYKFAIGGWILTRKLLKKSIIPKFKQ